MTAPPRGPLAGAEVWHAVITTAGSRCECAGECGRSHREDKHRCAEVHQPTTPLHAVPRHPTAPTAATALPVGELYALCHACHRGVIRRREATRRRTPAPTPDALF